MLELVVGLVVWMVGPILAYSVLELVHNLEKFVVFFVDFLRAVGDDLLGIRSYSLSVRWQTSQ